MYGTIETTHNNILLKINSVIEICKLFEQVSVNINEINEIHRDIIYIKENYEMSSIKLLSDYFLLVNDYNQQSKEDVFRNEFIEKKDNYIRLYQMFIRKENFIGSINRLMDILKSIISHLDSEISQKKVIEIKHIINKFESSSITYKTTETIYNKCGNCGNIMKISSSTSEIVCINCGVTENLYATVFEDENMYNQEKSKHGSYDPSKHCKFWIERIQARESKEIPNKILESIRKCIKRDKIRDLENITCEDIRKYLSQTKNSSFNEHVPLIRKLITGISPPQLSDYELQLIHMYFDKIVKIYEETKPDDKTNVPYHPYIIYKIIEHILSSEKKRLSDILSCIHLQSRETLIENDRTWKKICQNLGCIKYTPTDRNNHIPE